MAKKIVKKIIKGNFIKNCIPSKGVSQDWKFEQAVNGGAIEFESATSTIPESVDLREDWWKINTQGDTGGCVGWALGDGVLRWHFVKANRIKPTESFSPRFIWMAAKETDEFVTRPTSFIELEGTSLKAGMEICKKYGAVTNAILPFNSKSLYKGPTNDFYALASKNKIAAYFNLELNMLNCRTWLATKGPILARINCDKSWDNLGKKGLLEKYIPSPENLGHAVAIVGYTPKYLIIRNSWGTEWGANGFGFATLEYAKAAFSESYGISL